LSNHKTLIYFSSFGSIVYTTNGHVSPIRHIIMTPAH